MHLCIPSSRQKTVDGVQRNCFLEYHLDRAKNQGDLSSSEDEDQLATGSDVSDDGESNYS